MMGHPFGFSGTVEHGKKIGTSLGFPTINIMPGTEKMVPEFGVYASHTIVTDENGSKTFNSITNVGNNPTVSNTERRLRLKHLFMTLIRIFMVVM